MHLHNFADDNTITATGKNINDLLHTLHKEANTERKSKHRW